MCYSLGCSHELRIVAINKFAIENHIPKCVDALGTKMQLEIQCYNVQWKAYASTGAT